MLRKQMKTSKSRQGLGEGGGGLGTIQQDLVSMPGEQSEEVLGNKVQWNVHNFNNLEEGFEDLAFGLSSFEFHEVENGQSWAHGS